MKRALRVFTAVGICIWFGFQSIVPALALTGDTTRWLGVIYRGDGGDANAAYLDNPDGFAAGPGCNLYIADTNDNVVRKLTISSNVISTTAGNGQYGLRDGSARTANFKAPSDIAIGADGRKYIADTDNKRIRIEKNGVVTTWLTNIKRPTGLLLVGSTLYIAETGNNRILKATVPSGTPSTVATLTTPGKMVKVGNALYVINNGKTTVSKVDLGTGTVTTLKSGLADAEGIDTLNGDVYFTAGLGGLYNEIWKYSLASDKSFTRLHNVLENNTYNHASDLLFCGGKMYLLFTGGSSVYRANLDGSNPVKIAGADRYGNTNGPASQVMLGRPKAMVLSKDREYVYLLENHVFKKFHLKTRTLSFVAGFARDNFKDLAGADGRVSGPTQMVLSPDGTKIFFADRNNNRIRALTLASRKFSTITGSGIINAMGAAKNGYAEGGRCTTFDRGRTGCAYFERPMGIAVSPSGRTLYIADTGNNRIRKVDVATGRTKLLAGSGIAGLRNGAGSTARFKGPVSLAVTSDNRTLYVLEQGNHALRKIDLRTNVVSAVLGSGKAGFRDGAFRDARLSYPDSIAWGTPGVLYLSEVGSQKIRKADLNTGQITTLAGAGGRGYVNGRGNVAKFNNPRGMVMLTSSYLLVADQTNDMIRAVKLK